MLFNRENIWLEKTEKDSSHKKRSSDQTKEAINIEDHTSEESYQDISMLQKTETEIINMCQARHFWTEIEAVNAGNRVPSKVVFINWIHSSTKMVSSEWVEDL